MRLAIVISLFWALAVARGADSPAPTPNIPALSNTGAMLTAGEREIIVRTGVEKGNWIEMAETLRKALLADRNGFALVNPAWSERLHLCQVFYWLGQNETEQAAIYLSTRINNKDGKITVENLREALNNPDVVQKLGRGFVDPEDYPKDQILARRLKPEALQAILTNPAFVEQLAETVSREDYLPGAFRVLNDLYQHAPFTFGQYPALAVAFAVVYDEPVLGNWPHHQVPRDTVPLALGNWCALYDYFTAGAQSRELLMDVQKLRADQLKFMIDAPLKVEELQWAKKNVRLSRGKFDDAFSMIHYDTQRVRVNAYTWPYPDYALATISKSGGICVDQAYFAAVAGKARGLPTLFFVGQGSDGGHAWFGYLKTDEKWIMDAGRYENQKYVTGYAYDPQNWKPINDHQLNVITNRATLSPEYRHSNSLLVLASMSDAEGDNTATFDLYQAALKTAPNNSAAWIGMAEFLRSTKQIDPLKQHLQAMSKQFDNEGDLKTYALQQLVEVARDAGDSTTVASLQQEMVQANRVRRSDLSIQAGSDILNEKLAAQDYQGAYMEYKNLVRRFKSDGGGNLFYDVIAPFVMKLNEAGQGPLARNALDFARSYMKPDPDSLVGKGFDKVADEIGAKSRR